ncbi:MAG: NfeD family protein [Dehalococcoidia bacterium]|nr:NfeD family protein [Dehalococcoidia bacterium]
MDLKRYTVHTIITTLLEQAALVAVVVWLLPMVGINIPVWGLVLMMISLGTYAFITYRLGRKTLCRRPIVSPDVGSRGRTTTLVSPTGYVRVNGELWRAWSGSAIGAGEEVTVAGMEQMTLLVNPVSRTGHGGRIDADNHTRRIPASEF